MKSLRALAITSLCFHIAVFSTPLAAQVFKTPKGRGNQPASSPLAGKWQGTGTEQMDYGPVTYPVTINFQVSPQGITADARAEVELPTETGQKVSVSYHGLFSGNASGQNIQLTSTRIDLMVKQTGERIQLPTQYMRLTVQGQQMTGQVGNDSDGWTQLRLQKAGQPPTPTPPRPNPPTPNPPFPPGPEGGNSGVSQHSSLRPGLDPMVSGMPGAANMKAPPSLRPGMRLTFWLGTADVIGSPGQSTLRPDPNGRWKDKDGKTYSEDVTPTGGGAVGFTVIDVIAVTDQAVAMVSTQFQDDGTMSPPVATNSISFICHPSGCEYWIHPQLLAQVQPGQYGGVNFLRGPYQSNGQTVDALMIQVRTANSSSHNVYDMKTGFNLTMSARMQSKKKQNNFNPATGQVTPGQRTDATLVVSQLRGVRQVQVPWLAAGTPPETPGRALRYRGQQSLDMGMGYPTSSPMNATITAKHVDGAIIQYEQVMEMPQSGGGPFRSMKYCAAGQIGSMTMHPQALSALRSGQEIDNDPITRTRTFVEHVGQNQMGQSVIAITEKGQSGFRRWVYDSNTGVLLEAVHQYSMGGPSTAVTSYVFQLVQ